MFYKRVVIVGPFNAAGNIGRFYQGEFFRLFIKIISGSNTKSQPISAHIELVSVKLEYLFLIVMIFQF